MKKKKFILIIFLLFITNIIPVSAIFESFGEGIGSSSNGGGSTGATLGDWYLLRGMGLKVSLVKFTNNSLDLVSYYYIMGNPTSDYNMFMRSSGGDYNVAGAGAVYGSIGSSYTATPLKAPVVTTTFSSSKGTWFASSGAMYNILVTQKLKPNLTEDKIYDMLYNLLVSSNYTKNSNNLPSEINKYNFSNVNDVKDLFTNTTKAVDASTLSDYRLIIEPIYAFRNTNNINQHRFATLKTVAVTNLTTTSKSERYGGIGLGANRKLTTNFRSCNSEKNAPVNCNDDSEAGMTSVISGLGYFIVTITTTQRKCDPATECCYNKNGIYKIGYKNVDQNHYRCLISTRAGENCPINQTVSCKVEIITDCSDSVDAAICDSSDPENESGTHVVFYENSNLSSCTLDNSKNSGFTLLKTDYCSVACKDDINAYLPTYRTNIAAGTYFDLTYYTSGLKELAPTLSINRTCVTSKIDHSKFESDLESYAQNTLIPAYNYWQDMLDIYNFLNKSGDYSTTKHGENTAQYTTCTKSNCEGDNCEVPYTYYEWSLYSHEAKNDSNNDYDGDSDTYYPSKSVCDIEKDGTKYSKAESDAQKTYKDKESAARETYIQALKTYNNIVANYNKCYNWTNETNNVSYETSGTDLEEIYKLKTGTANNTEKYDLTFHPDVTFDYTDDSNVFGNNFTYRYNNADIVAYKTSYDGSDDSVLNSSNKVNLNGSHARPLTDLIYWNNSIQNDSTYSSVNTSTSLTQGEKQDNNCTKSGSNCKTIYLYDCTGDNCDEANTYALSINTRDYIKRTETVTYEYHLPRVVSQIPTGKVKNAGSYVSFNNNVARNQLLLDAESVPINIKTEAGTYEYSLKIENIEDDVRRVANSTNDNFKERFNGETGNGALNSGNAYVCTYGIVNDIYEPSNDRDLFFYRVIDMYDINPNAPIGRELGYNWTTSFAYQIQNRMKEEDNNYQELTNNSETDKFSFRLTPVMMRQIREYNATKNSSWNGGYADWELRCEDNGKNDYYCYSNFLKCLTSSGHPEAGFSSCSNVFNSYSYTYTDIDLNRNRGILKSKVGG